MEQFIARQPILNLNKRLYGYELLYRGAPGRMLGQVSGEQATAGLLTSAFLTGNIDVISNNRLCFVNFTTDLLEKNLPLSFPKTKIVVEILEDVKPTPNIISICRNLKENGYTLALDDFVYRRELEPLLELVKIVKIDIRLTPLNTLVRTLNLLKHHQVKLLAEKVETEEEFALANRMGFSYFQGYFFCKPQGIKIKEISSVKLNLLRLLAEVTKKEIELERLREIISADVAITFKLLRFLNSAYYYLLQKVRSVQHGVALLGERELRRFCLLVIISELATEKPDELVRVVLVRAKFCELLGNAANLPESDCANLYMTGLFSLLDAMLDLQMSEILEKLPINAAVKDTLMGKENIYMTFLRLSQAFEKNVPPGRESSSNTCLLTEEQIQSCYLEAVKYANYLS
ncbi:HDOD domain-containing protein [Desulfopila sp. IMCC35006]|uniref:EAL and HDOD domain-containing protein n=1 Tax=Desulfopila sp. IMCC35006 TaxID=2569542 RepID=UPI0010AD0BD3|nr:HDOD domain-containing protein [Desulfopila sp. IMCC35006]TKB28570.1 HDOD domain-containing protein [Desulfopila sp. IMCC35006]